MPGRDCRDRTPQAGSRLEGASAASTLSAGRSCRLQWRDASRCRIPMASRSSRGSASGRGLMAGTCCSTARGCSPNRVSPSPPMSGPRWKPGGAREDRHRRLARSRQRGRRSPGPRRYLASGRQAIGSPTQSLGIRVVLVTGDNLPNRRIADELGIDEVHAEVLPSEKVEVVQQLQAQGRRSCLRGGDGVDRPGPALRSPTLASPWGSAARCGDRNRRDRSAPVRRPGAASPPDRGFLRARSTPSNRTWSSRSGCWASRSASPSGIPPP